MLKSKRTKSCGPVFAAFLLASMAMPATSFAAELFKASSTVAQTSTPSAKADKRTKRERIVDIDVAVLADQLLPAGSDMAADRTERSRQRAGRVTLKLFDDVSIDLKRHNVEDGFDGGVVWTGDTNDGGFGILVVHNNRITGTVQSAGRHFLIDSVTGGAAHRVREIDTEAYPQDVHLEPQRAAQNKRAAETDRSSPPGGRATTTITDATILVTYTAKAKTMLGATMADKIKLDIALVNQGLSNSRVPLRIHLVGIKPVQSSYNERSSSDAAQPLYDITYGADYNFPALRTTRTSLAADLVTMYADRPEYCGIAWVLYPGLNAGYAFSVINAACQGTLTLAHELGHNMGLYHDRYVEQDAPVSQYNFGYVSIPGAFRTIMSYSNRCTAAGISCTRITYYSTPLRTYNGIAVGVAQGQPGAADAARLLRANRTGIAAFR